MEGDPGYTDYSEIFGSNNQSPAAGLFRPFASPVNQAALTAERGSFVEDFSSALWKGISYPFTATGTAVADAVDSVKTTVKSFWIYLVGGIAIVGIIAIVLLGAGSRFMARIEGR